MSRGGGLSCCSLLQCPTHNTHSHTLPHTDILAFALDVLIFSMFSMLAMQLFCTLVHAIRIYSQKLRCPSELNQLPEPGRRLKRSNEALLPLRHCYSVQSRRAFCFPAYGFILRFELKFLLTNFSKSIWSCAICYL